MISERYASTRYNQFNDLLWSDREVQRLLNSYLECDREQLLELFPNRTYVAIKTKAKQLGINKTPRWTHEEIKKIKELGPTVESIEELAKQFPGRTLSAVDNKFYGLGLNLKPEDKAAFRLVQDSCTTSLLYLLNELHLVQHSCTTTEKNKELSSRDVVQDLCTTISNKRWPITKYFLVYGAATAWTLRFRLSAKKRTVYEALEQLRATGLIIDYHQVPNFGKKAVPSTVWGIQTASNDQVREAQMLHTRLCSPKYRTAEKVGQTILEEWMNKGLKEIHYNEIMKEVKELKIPFKGPDIADLTAQFLHENGIKVWR